MNTERQLPQQDISFVTAEDGTQIAVATMGRGPVVVRAAHWLSHVSLDIESPVWRHWLAELSHNHRLVRYDLRGCGLSDRKVLDISFDAWLSDLEAVTEKIDEPFTLVGMSQGGALAIAYALKHPKKVERLVLIGSYARGMLARAQSEHSHLEAETLSNLIRLGWGREVAAFNQVFTNLFIPGGTPEQHAWWQKLERDTASPETAVRTIETLHYIDVLEKARKLDVPTLVLHSRHDARIPFDEGCRLAAAISEARFVPLESANHVLLDHEPAWNVFKSELKAFLPNTSADNDLGEDFGLTSAETAVVELVAKGMANAEIAKALGKSEKTVRNQVSVVFEKMDVRTRAEAIVRLLTGK
jgi:pimeloyl-ACP methyl ester carboxylesterase/DNA-binding CsgD family transcriptional regulator